MKFNKANLLILFLIGLFWSCNSTKRVPKNRYLLTQNKIFVDSVLVNSEEVNLIPIQKENSKFLTIPFALHIFNLAKPNNEERFRKKYIDDTLRYQKLSKLLSEKQVYRLSQSFWYKGFPNFLRNYGERPSIIDSSLTVRSLQRFKQYYFNQGYFEAAINYTVDSIKPQKAVINYHVQRNNPTYLGSISQNISSKTLDSLYQIHLQDSHLKENDIYNTKNFEQERQRLNQLYRNNGVYNFQPNYVRFNVDTVATNKKANIALQIGDYEQRKSDTIFKKPFMAHQIKRINIFTYDSRSSEKNIVVDSTSKGINIISLGNLKYKPKALINNLFINTNELYEDQKVQQTSMALNNLKVFNFPTIQFEEIENDDSRGLIANIFLRPKKKFITRFAVDFTHSNIQDFGIAANTSVLVNNVFGGAESFQFGVRGNIGASRDLSGAEDRFFNVVDYGIDSRLIFPRILFPFDTSKLIPNYMLPNTNINFGFSKQENIGLDKENFTGALSYQWIPKTNNFVRFDLLNVQYVNNLRTNNYFNIYRSSFNQLNQIANTLSINPAFLDENSNLIIESGTQGFIDGVLNNEINIGSRELNVVRSIEERRQRLIENNLILSSSFSINMTNKSDISDNSFSVFRTKLESAGNVLSLLSNLRNDVPENEFGNRTFLDVAYAQYIKTEFEYIKHWDLNKLRVFAVRSFVGIAIPYGNSNNIPFQRSYFAGGSNDNRAWRPFSLGPGASASLNDFNEANLKLAFNAEFRFKLFGSFRGALFADAGNIWHVFDNQTLQEANFVGWQSLRDLALGSGFGIRYDAGFFAIRIDSGFKTYNPALPLVGRWFKEYNFKNAVLNLGINYPF